MTTLDEAGRDAPAPASAAGGRAGSARRRWRALGVAAACASAAACLVLTVLWRAGAGWDHVDEAFYLLTAAPPRPDDAFNGLSGPYLRALWELAGWNVAAVRVLGAAGLAGAAGLLGAATARLLGRRPATLVAATIAAGTGYYATLLRTPSYNWLAVVGAGLACTGVLHLIARGPARWGALCGLGVCVAGLGKVTTGLVLALVVALVALRTRPRALAWGAVVALLALVVHVVAVLPLGTTLAVLTRSSRHLAVFAPDYYTPSSALLRVAAGMAVTLVVSVAAGGALGLLPLAAAPHPRRARAFTVLAVVAVVACVTLTLVTRIWALDYREAEPNGTGLLALVVCLLLAAWAGRLLRLDPRPDPRPDVQRDTADPQRDPHRGAARRPLAAAAVLVVAAVACVAGSNVAFGFLLNMTGLLLVPACFCLVAALPRVAVPAVHTALVAVVCAASLVAASAVAREPKWTGRLVDATTAVRLGPATVRVDATTAHDLEALRSAAERDGWTAGSPLLDAAYVPSVALALGADVPPVLLPTLPLQRTDPVCSAVHGLGAHWRDAWLLLPERLGVEDSARIARYLGRRYPQDYRTVARFADRFVPVRTVLLRPVVPAPPWSAELAATSCLGRQ